MNQEYVILVNERDEVIGQAEKLAAHQQALLHRAFSVMLYRKTEGELEFLLQKRAADKYHGGGLWTNTCCSHPRPSEDTRVAAERRLQEEVGVSVKLKEIGHFTYMAHFDNGLTEHEFDHVLVAEYAGMPQDFNPGEISELKWVKARELEVLVQNHPQQFTPWLGYVLAVLASRLSS